MEHTIYVMDENFSLAAVISDYASFQMKRRLYEVGDMELHLPYGARGAGELRPGRVLFLEPGRPGILTKIEVSESKKGVELAAYGTQLKGIVARRITVPDAEDERLLFGYDRFPAPDAPEAPAESIFKHYAARHMLSPFDERRRIPRLAVAEDLGRGMRARWSSRFEGLDKVFQALGEYTGMGYDLTLDLEQQRYVFDVIAGQNRASTSSAPVVFSVQYGNVQSTKYSLDTKPYINAAYAGGAGEGEARLIQTVFRENAEGLERRESWLDLGNIEMVEDLLYEAQHKLEKSVVTETLTGAIVQTGPFIYGKDYDLGDTVTVHSRATGLEKDAQITEISESYEKGQRKVSVTFGKRQQNILDEIRRSQIAR